MSNTKRLLQAAKDVYKNYFEIDLPALAERAWEKLIEAARRRNFVVHNAGHDLEFRPVEIERSHVEQTRETVSRLVRERLRAIASKSAFAVHCENGLGKTQQTKRFPLFRTQFRRQRQGEEKAFFKYHGA